MAMLVGRTSRVHRSVRGERGRFFAALLFLVAGIFIANAAANAGSDLKRVVLGTIVSAGALEVQSAQGSWIPAIQGTPVLEDTHFRTGRGSKAMVALGKEGVIGVREGSGLHIGSLSGNGLPVSLRGDSELTFRLPTTTKLAFRTDAAVVEAKRPTSAPAGEVWIQGTIAQQGNETIINVLEGDLQVKKHNTPEFATLGSGEQARIAGSMSTPRIARMTDASKTTSKKRMAAMFGTKTSLIVGGATAAALGAGLGGAAAAGAFDDDPDTAAQGTPGKPAASPFRP